MKYLELYYKWMKKGEIPKNGLCSVKLHYHLNDFWMFNPDEPCPGYWGYDGSFKYFDGWVAEGTATRKHKRKFTAMRQTIILLLAAMNDEL